MSVHLIAPTRKTQNALVQKRFRSGFSLRAPASAPFGGRLVNDGCGSQAQALEANVDTLRTRRNIVNHSATMDCAECLRKSRLLLLVTRPLCVSLAFVRDEFFSFTILAA